MSRSLLKLEITRTKLAAHLAERAGWQGTR